MTWNGDGAGRVVPYRVGDREDETERRWLGAGREPPWPLPGATAAEEGVDVERALGYLASKARPEGEWTIIGIAKWPPIVGELGIPGEVLGEGKPPAETCDMDEIEPPSPSPP